MGRKRPERESGGMNEQERQKYIGIINGMSEEEKQGIAELLPVEICAKRVLDELKRLQETESAIAKIMQGQRGQL